MNKEENIINTNLAEALTDRYLSYALSTIVSRSLPDVRDGLKPVHRRILYAMRELKLNPEGGFKKCARVVGDVIGKFHPHGDASVYDAMVRLAQDFSVRYPLVNGQGNFGNIDGDSAAAMRYTEAKLTEVAWLLMEGLDEDAVDFRDTYDGEENEPIVMPAKFPNLLANGSTGIAVGMATNIPPHNVIEICDALKALIQNPDITIENIVKKYIKAPDFPTGGVLIEPLDSIIQSYTVGKGAFKVRAKWEKEELSRGLYQIIITEIPYQVQKSKLIERIADLLENHKLPLINDIRDESTELIRIVIEPKSRTVNPEHIMEHLFKLTELEARFNMNLNVIDEKNIPKVMNLKEILQAFLRHRQQVLVRISNFNLNKILKRLEILEGYLIAYLNLDEVIKIIRENDEPRPILISRFNLTENQAEAILNMKLRALRKLEEIEIKSEHAKLTAEKEDLEKLLADENLRWLKIADEISEVKAIFSKRSHLGKRKTQLGEMPEIIDVPIEAFIEKEPITVIFSEKGWVRAVKSHISLDEDFKFKDNDSLKTVIHTTTTDKILFFTNMGKFYTVSAADFPQGRGFGQPLSLFMDFEAGEELLFIFNYQKDEKLLVVSISGRGFIVDANSVLAQTKNGKKILNLDTGEEAYKCLEIVGDTVAIIGENRRLLMFPVSEIPEMTRGRGVMLQKYKSGKMADIMIFNKNDGFTYLYKDKQRVEADLSAWFGKRAGLGRLPPVGFSRENKFDINKNDGKF